MTTNTTESFTKPAPRKTAGWVRCAWVAAFLPSFAWSVIAQQALVLVPQIGHTDQVNGVAFSPDGRTLASGSNDGTVILWDAATGEVIRKLTEHTDFVTSVAFSPDGRTLASGSWDNTVILWDAATGEVIRKLTGHTDRVTSVAFSPDGRMLASGSWDKTVILYDTATGEVKRTLTGQAIDEKEFSAKGATCTLSVAFSPDGRTLASGGDDKTIILYDAATGEVIRTLTGHTTAVQSVAVSPDGRTVASGYSDGTVILWDAATGEVIRKLMGCGVIAFSPDGRTLATWGFGGTVLLLDAATGKVKRTLSRREDPMVTSVAISPDGRTLASGYSDGTVILWDAATGEVKRTLSRREDPVLSVVFSPDGLMAASGGNGSCFAVVVCWDVATGEIKRALSERHGDITSADFSPDGRTVATGSCWDNTVILYDAATGEVKRTLTGHTHWVRSVAFSPDGRTVATGSEDKTVILYDAATGEIKRKLSGPTGIVNSVAFSPDGRTVVSGSDDKTVILYDAATGEVIRKLTGHTGRVTSMAFSPDGRTLATGSADDTAILWDLATGEVIRKLTGHAIGLYSIAFSPDGRTLAADGQGGTVILYDAATGEVIRTLTGHTGRVTSMAFSPDGRTVAAGNVDGTVGLWDAASGGELATFFSLDQGQDWLATTPAGYYDASLNGDRMVRWRMGGRLYPVEQFEGRYRRPDLVAKALRGEPLPAGLPVMSAQHAPPSVTLEVAGGKVEISGDTVKVRIVITPGAPDAAITQVELRVNGRPVDLSRAKALTLASKALTPASKGVEVVGRVQQVQRLSGDSSDNRIYVDATIALLPGEQEARLTATAFDDEGLHGDSPPVIIHRLQPAIARSDLYVLAVGVSRNATPQYSLHYADADATALASTLEGQSGKAFRNVYVETITDEQATNQGILAGLRWLQTTPRADDIVVVLFSGHGVRGQLGKLYFFTYNGDLDALRDTCLAWDEVDAALHKCHARQVLMLMDCCHAGAFGDRQATTDELADRLVKKAGVMVLASCRGTEQSLESDQWDHGAFTEAVIDGLRGAADPYKRGYISVSSLLDYVSTTVPRMTGDRQHPWLPRMDQFDPQLELAAVK